jgi:MFS family permease
MGLLAATVGQISDRVGPEKVIAVAAFSTAIAYVLLSFLAQPWQLLLIYATLIGVSLSIHDIVTLSTVAKWFPRRRGVMSGLVKVGTAVGQMAVPMLVVLLITMVGWRTSLVWLGVGSGILLLVAALLMGVKPITAATGGHRGRHEGVTFSQAKRDRTLWLLCAVQLFSFSSLTTITTHIVPHAIDNGFNSSAAAGLLTVIAASSVFGRLLLGYSFDQLGGKYSYLICLALLTISLVLLLLIVEPRYFYVFAMVYGFTHGGLFTVVSPTVAERFGLREHGKIFGFIVFFGTLGGSIMPIVAGRVFDVLDSYTLAFITLAVLAVCSLICASLITTKPAAP